MNEPHYLTQGHLDKLKAEYDELRREGIPAIAKKIDEAKQMGDLSENAEYHSAREEMAWAQTRLIELQKIIEDAQIISTGGSKNDEVDIGSTVIVEVSGKKKEYAIVGPQEADPLKGKISNESPLGQAFIGKRIGDQVEVQVPAGRQIYTIKEIH